MSQESGKRKPGCIGGSRISSGLGKQQCIRGWRPVAWASGQGPASGRFSGGVISASPEPRRPHWLVPDRSWALFGFRFRLLVQAAQGDPVCPALPSVCLCIGVSQLPSLSRRPSPSAPSVPEEGTEAQGSEVTLRARQCQAGNEPPGQGAWTSRWPRLLVQMDRQPGQ